MEHKDIIALQSRLRGEIPGGEKQLVVFRRQYLQRVDARYISWPAPELLQIYDVQRWIYDAVTDSRHVESRTRQDVHILNKLVDLIQMAVEGTEEPDVFDPLVELCAELCSMPRLDPAEAAQRDVWTSYEAPSIPDLSAVSNAIKLFEKPHVLSAGGCSGYRTWQAALALAQRISIDWLPMHHLVGKKVLELGAGTGLLSFLCAVDGGARRVVATDGDADAVQRLLISNAANGHASPSSASKLAFGVYRWAEPFHSTVLDCFPKDAFDVILAADVTYDPGSIPSLVQTFQALFRMNSKTIVIVSATLRNQATFDVFMDTCRELGLFTRKSRHEPESFEKQLGFFNTNEEAIMMVSVTAVDVIDQEQSNMVDAIHAAGVEP